MSTLETTALEEAPEIDKSPAVDTQQLAAALEAASASVATGAMGTLNRPQRLDGATLSHIETLDAAGATQTLRLEPLTDEPENLSVRIALENAPFFRHLSEGDQNALSVHAEHITLEQTEYIHQKGLYIATNPEGAQLAVMDGEKFTGIIWEVGQGAQFGEFMFAFGFKASAQLAVLSQPTFIFISHDAIDDLSLEGQNILKMNAILSARKLNKTNEALLVDQEEAAVAQDSIEVPNYGGTDIPTWFTENTELTKETFKPGREIVFSPGTQYILKRGSALVKDHTGIRTLGRLTPPARMGEISTVSHDNPDNPTARIFADTSCEVWSIPLADPSNPRHSLQLDDIGAALQDKLRGIAKHQSELRQIAASS